MSTTLLILVAAWAGIQYAATERLGCYLGERFLGFSAMKRRQFRKGSRARWQAPRPEPQQWQETRTWMLQRSLRRGVRPVLEAVT